MKTLQKATLAAAIAAAPFFAVNAMEALDDDVLSEMTGQAGVTIETTTGAAGTTIGHIFYTDTDGLDEGANTGGSVAIVGNGSNPAISSTGGTYTDNGDGTYGWVGGDVTTKQIIDVDSQGNLVIQKENLTAGQSTRLDIGQVQLRSRDQQDNGDTNAGAEGAVLVSDLTLIQTEGLSGETHIINLSDDNNSTVVSGVYSSIDTNLEQGVDISRAEASGSQLAIVSKGSSKIDRMDAKLLGGAIEIEGLSYVDADTGSFMESTSVIWAVGGDASTDANAGVWIQGSDSKGTLAIDAIKIGGSSIGDISIGTINQAGTVTRIYGH